MKNDKLELADLFLWNARGVDENGQHLGELLPTGVEPSFLARMLTEGISPKFALFRPAEDPTSARFKQIQAILESTGIKWPI